VEIPPATELAFQFGPSFYKISRVPYGGLEVTIKVSQNAIGAFVIEPAEGGPAVTLGPADSSREKPVTLAAGGAGINNLVTVITTYTGSTLAGAAAPA